MNSMHTTILGASAVLLTGGAASAQLTIDWYTIDGGGGVSTGSGFTLSGTIGQPDAGVVAGGVLECGGGYWAGRGSAPACYANCDGSTQPPALNVADFSCFLQRYASADPYANCDGSTQAPIFNVSDFTCFLQKYAMGCP